MIENEKKEDLITNLKKYSIGFPCIYKIDNHYTGADYRLFINTEFGIVTIFLFSDNKIKIKGSKFLDLIKEDLYFKNIL